MRESDETYSDRCMSFNHVDSTTTMVEPHNRGYYTKPNQKGFNSINGQETNASIPYYLYNVRSVYGAESNFICFSIGGILKPVHEFKNGKYTVSNDMTIVGLGTGECLDENTLITMWDGKQKAMKDIEIGDEVLSIDYETMTLVPRKVIYTSKDEADYDSWTVPAYYLHTFSDGTVIKRAMRHRFYNLESQGYKHMHTWENGLHTYKIDGTNSELVSTEIVYEELHYARITLEGSNNYFANGLSTGDSECCPNKVVLDKLLEKAK